MCDEIKELSVTELGNPRKPQGSAGEEMLSSMNEHHSAVTDWALGFLDVKGDSRALDIGCGGGATLAKIASKIVNGHVTGADYSAVSVRMSAETNKTAVSSGKMDIIEASVEKLPFPDNSFDRIITVESFYFWPDPQENLKEVFRILDNGGRFLIVADINGDAELTDDDIANIAKYELFNPGIEEFRELLKNAGFIDVEVHTEPGTSWVCAEGRK